MAAEPLPLRPHERLTQPPLVVADSRPEPQVHRSLLHNRCSDQGVSSRGLPPPWAPRRTARGKWLLPLGKREFGCVQPGRRRGCCRGQVAPGLTGLPWCLLPLSSLVLHNITRGIFEAIVEQAPFAIEDLLNEVDSQEEEEDDDDEDNEDGMSEDDECKQDVPSGKPGNWVMAHPMWWRPSWPSKLQGSPLIWSSCSWACPQHLSSAWQPG